MPPSLSIHSTFRQKTSKRIARPQNTADALLAQISYENPSAERAKLARLRVARRGLLPPLTQ
jgi:hypothetical protein